VHYLTKLLGEYQKEMFRISERNVSYYTPKLEETYFT